MSSKGELFIREDLTSEAERLGLFDVEDDYMLVPKKYYKIWDAMQIPTKDKILLEDDSYLEFTGKGKVDGDGYSEYHILSITRNGVTKLTNGEEYIDPKDWYFHLQPIVEDLLDGEPKLTRADVDYLMPILRAKIEFFNGLISKEDYETILNNTDN